MKISLKQDYLIVAGRYKIWKEGTGRQVSLGVATRTSTWLALL